MIPFPSTKSKKVETLMMKYSSPSSQMLQQKQNFNLKKMLANCFATTPQNDG